MPVQNWCAGPGRLPGEPDAMKVARPVREGVASDICRLSASHRMRRFESCRGHNTCGARERYVLWLRMCCSHRFQELRAWADARVVWTCSQRPACFQSWTERNTSISCGHPQGFMVPGSPMLHRSHRSGQTRNNCAADFSAVPTHLQVHPLWLRSTLAPAMLSLCRRKLLCSSIQQRGILVSICLLIAHSVSSCRSSRRKSLPEEVRGSALTETMRCGTLYPARKRRAYASSSPGATAQVGCSRTKASGT